MEHTSETRRRKRKQRAVLSCNDCRRRKLKCDRELPCNRCTQGGVADKCAYGKSGDRVQSDVLQQSGKPSTRQFQSVFAPTTQSHHSSAEPGPYTVNMSSEHTAPDLVSGLEQRLAFLEAQLLSLQPKSDQYHEPNAKSENAQVGKRADALAVFFKGRDYRTFYYGPTCPMTVISHFPDLRPFMKRIVIGSAFQRLRQEWSVKEDQLRTTKSAKQTRRVSSLRSLLPDRDTVDKVVATYLATFETTYRILHVPTFWSSYQTYWETPLPPNSDFDAILLAVIACTLCTSTHATTQYGVDGSTFRNQAIIWLKGCEAWLKRQSNKHRTLAVLQEYYQEVQQHMALMKAYGMHRDPTILGARCTIFEGEMRRRLWATSMELELQASIDKGTPSVLYGLEHDCAPPRNLMDFELHAEMKELPESQPSALYSDTSFLHCSLQSISLRVRLCSVANSLRSSTTFQDILQDEQSVQDALARIPKWKESHTLLSWTLLDLQLRQFLVILHTDRVLKGQLGINSEYRYSMLTCLDASTALLERHVELMDTGNFALCCIRSDYLRAGLLICHIAYHASVASEMLVTRVARSMFDETMRKAFSVLEQRSLRPGRGNHQYWYLSAACSLVGIQFEPGRAQALEKQATDRMCKLVYKILSLQEEDAYEENLCIEVILGNGSPSTPTFAPNSTEIVDAASFPIVNHLESQPNLPAFDVLDGNAASAWMLDDFWFMDGLPSPEFT